MSNARTKPRLTSFAPQLLVEDLARSLAYYQKLGFTFGEPDFYVEDPDGYIVSFGGRPAAE